MSHFNNESSLIDEIRSIVKKEIEKTMKDYKEGRVRSYSSIMTNAKMDQDLIYSKIPNLTSSFVFDNKNAYRKMKNRVNYGFSSDSKTFVNKASRKTNLG